MKGEGAQEVGLLAQQVAEVLPEAASQGSVGRGGWPTAAWCPWWSRRSRRRPPRSPPRRRSSRRWRHTEREWGRAPISLLSVVASECGGGACVVG